LNHEHHHHHHHYYYHILGLKSSLLEIANRSKKLTDVKLQASKQSQQAMQYLQMQQQQLQAIQQQLSVRTQYVLHEISSLST
jgi:phage gp46-like protein